MELKELFSRAAAKTTRRMTWQQTIDLVCTMLFITNRHIIIDSSRAVVHLSWQQLGRPQEITIPFNDIVAAINKAADDPSEEMGLDATAVSSIVRNKIPP